MYLLNYYATRSRIERERLSFNRDIRKPSISYIAHNSIYSYSYLYKKYGFNKARAYEDNSRYYALQNRPKYIGLPLSMISIKPKRFK